MSSFVNGSIFFITNHLHDIILVALGILIFTIVKVKYFNNDEQHIVFDKKVKKEIIVEGMETKNKTLFDNIIQETTNDFCEKLKGNSHLIEKQCEKQSNNKCKQRNCCVLLHNNNESKCVSGNKFGPTYHTDEQGKNINFDYYYYQNKCYGDSCVQ